MKLDTWVANAYAAQASGGEACWSLDGTGALLGSSRSHRRSHPVGAKARALPLPSTLALVPGWCQGLTS